MKQHTKDSGRPQPSRLVHARKLSAGQLQNSRARRRRRVAITRGKENRSQRSLFVSTSHLIKARPIFIVGSPRSGTSILSWCLGQHSNILVQEESSWIGPLTIQMEIAYRVGTARGERSQLSALGVARENYFAVFGEAIDNLILEHRGIFEQRCRSEAQTKSLAEGGAGKPRPTPAGFQIARTEADPKRRWVDGTPEYSFYIHPLAKLFPGARFIHVVRDVAAVVRSMLTFQRTGGSALVQNEQGAYDYWLRSVRACLAAEEAYGSKRVRRVMHSDLICKPESALRRILDFLEEPFEPSCLEPLSETINSSRVPIEFDPTDPKTDPSLRAAARELSERIQHPAPELPANPHALADLEKQFSLLADELRQRLAAPANKRA